MPLFKYPKNFKTDIVSHMGSFSSSASVNCYNGTGDALAYMIGGNPNYITIIYDCHNTGSTSDENKFLHSQFFIPVQGDKLLYGTGGSFSNMSWRAIPIDQFNLEYKPELDVYFNVASIVIAIAIFGVAVRLLFYPWWRRIRR